MASSASRTAIACVLAFGFLLWPSATPAGDVQRGAPTFRPAQGQEVVNGSYNCAGTVFTDDQSANVSAYAYVSATSGITSDFSGNSQSSVAVPPDLDAMAEICEAHVSHVISQVPAICALGPIERTRGDFGNGSTTGSHFAFSCQGTRDEVIGVIGGFSRLAVTARLP